MDEITLEVIRIVIACVIGFQLGRYAAKRGWL